MPLVRWSFAGKVSAGFVGLLVLMAAVAALAARYFSSVGWIFVCVLLVGLTAGVWLIGRITRPLTRTLKGLSSGIASFADRDFSVRLASKRMDELGEIARLYNDASAMLQKERQEIRQRELLLGTALKRSPVAILLVNPLDRIIYANTEARRLLRDGGRIEGSRFSEIQEGCPREMRDILTSSTDGLFSVARDERIENYYLAQRTFQLNQRQHRLVLLQRITHELNRQEAEAWKKVIRVVCHELNNSLAPVSSLLHSAKTIARQPEPGARFEEIFGLVNERLQQIQQFIEGYARFARLPVPRKELVAWSELLSCLDGFPSVERPELPPSKKGWFDRAQMQQLLVNLVNNAQEASAGEPQVTVTVQQIGDHSAYLQVLDRGSGMDEETIQKAILPFYSTKTSGSGLGLPLCREIIEAHGGRIDLQSRQGGGTVVTCWLPGPGTAPHDSQ